ncbi:MAG: hypothetical protein M3436_20900 [Pseudomonadota bacterium]|nr:hypothetical protein [Pseudomonadota bacterium]
MSDTSHLVTSYQVEIKGDRALLTLESTETPNMMGGARIARAEYSSGAEPTELINRGGFLSMKRPIELLVPTLDLLRNESPVYLHGDGTVATLAETVGESEPNTEEAPDTSDPE